jgi:hypothetical protein
MALSELKITHSDLVIQYKVVAAKLQQVEELLVAELNKQVVNEQVKKEASNGTVKSADIAA